MSQIQLLEFFILRRLLRDRYIGAHQTLEENICKYVPKHARGDAKDAFERLKRRGWFLLKRKHYGTHVSLDPEKLEEIRAFLWQEDKIVKRIERPPTPPSS